MKKILALLLCVSLLLSVGAVSAAATEETDAGLSGARWFPCEKGREKDILWESAAGPNLFQPFYENADTTGVDNYLDTEYSEDGALTITRNGNDGQEGNYWPSVRTLYLEEYPKMDLAVADTLYFDIEASHQWNIYLNINNMTVKMAKSIAAACGDNSVSNTDGDGPAGSFKGSLNIRDVLEDIAEAEAGVAGGQFASAILGMKVTFVPQIILFVVGPVGANLTVNELYIASANDPAGENCEFVDMGLIYGDDVYDIVGEDDTAEDDATETVGADDSADTNEDTNEDTTTTTKAAAKEEGGANVGLIVGIVAAVVVIGAAVVVVAMKKKK